MSEQAPGLPPENPIERIYHQTRKLAGWLLRIF